MFNSAALLALARPNVVAGLFVEMQFSTVLRLNSSAVSIDWNGHTWLATGSLGSVQPIQDSSGEISDLQLSLSGVPSENIALALGDEPPRGKRLVIYMWVLDPDTHVLLDAQRVWGGALDQMSISENGGSSVLSVSAIHRAKLYQRIKPSRYTDADQQRLHPGDRSLEYINSQSTHQDVWPAAAFFRQ